jgi:hypothetical protein
MGANIAVKYNIVNRSYGNETQCGTVIQHNSESCLQPQKYQSIFP